MQFIHTLYSSAAVCYKNLPWYFQRNIQCSSVSVEIKIDSSQIKCVCNVPCMIQSHDARDYIEVTWGADTENTTTVREKTQIKT